MRCRRVGTIMPLLMIGWIHASTTIFSDQQWQVLSAEDKASELLFLRAVDAYADLRIRIQPSGTLRLFTAERKAVEEIEVSALPDWLTAHRHSVVTAHFPFGMDPDDHQPLSQTLITACRQVGIYHLTILAHRSSALPAERLVARLTATDILPGIDRQSISDGD